MQKTQKKKSDIVSLSRDFMHGCTHLFALCIASSILASLCELLIPKVISFTVDSIIGDKPVPEYLTGIVDSLGGIGALSSKLWLITLGVSLLAVVMGVFKYGETVFNRKASEKLVETVRNKLFRHIEKLPFSWFMKNQTGDIIQRCTSDVETVKAFLSEQLTTIISTVLLIVLSLFFMYSIDALLATIALVSIPIIVLYSALFHGKIGQGFMDCDENEGKLSAIVQENLTGVRVVRAFGREKYEVDKFTKQNIVYTDKWVHLSWVMSLFWATGDVLSGVQIMSVLMLGIVFCVNGRLTLGEMIAIVSYNSMLSWPVRSLGRVISEMSKANISFGRIGEIIHTDEEHDVPGAVDCDTSGDIVFDDVSFSYDGETKVLDHVSLDIKKGSTVGILGMTGSGKSTLVQLLCRLYPLPDDGKSGKITVSGVDIRNIKAESLRRSIGIVLQEPFLFSRTLRDNIGVIFDDPAAHENEIREGARIACLDETIESFTAGYDTMVGERGVTLSGGQKQRTAIARLLVEGTPVMIFDDSLSAVDSETDAKIRAALREKTADSTVIIISHRIQTLQSADMIAVMADGRIVERGNHAALLAQNGIYKKINDIQSSGITEEDGKEASV